MRKTAIGIMFLLVIISGSIIRQMVNDGKKTDELVDRYVLEKMDNIETGINMFDEEPLEEIESIGTRDEIMDMNIEIGQLVSERRSLRLYKQELLDNMSYTDTVNYNNGIKNEAINEVDNEIYSKNERINELVEHIKKVEVEGLDYLGKKKDRQVIEKKEQKVVENSKYMSIRHNGFKSDSIIQDYVNYAWEISNHDESFIRMLEGENGKWDPYRKSLIASEDSRGFCQMSRHRHSDVVDDKRFWSDWKRQMDRCYDKYKGGTKFYGKISKTEFNKRFTQA